MRLYTFFQLWIALAVSFQFNSARAQEPVALQSQLQHVKIYLRGAEVFRQTSIKVPKGTTEIVLKELSNTIDVNSIQVSTTNNVAVMSATLQINHLRQNKFSPEAKVFADSIEKASKRISLIQLQYRLFEEEEEILRSNKTVGGSSTGVNAADLIKVLELFRSRMGIISAEKLKLSESRIAIETQRNKWQSQLNELKGADNRTYGEIVLQLQSDEPTDTEIEFSYLVWNAGWNPLYNLRAEDVKKPVKLMYKANVYQASGEDWKQAHMVLSTGTPVTSSNLPVLHTKTIGFEDRNLFLGEKYMMSNSVSGRNDLNEYKWSFGDTDSVFFERSLSGARADKLSIIQSEVAVDFNIDLPYNIPSDNKVHLVAIREFELPAQFEYYVVPKAERAVFLTALVTQWQDANLLQGDVNLFFKGSFTGRGTLNPGPLDDTLRLSFGKDKKILVERKNMQDYTSKKLIGSNKKEMLGYEILLSNTNQEAVTIKVRDQVPVSNTQDISIDVLETSGASYNKETGELEWSVSLKAGESRKLRVSYSVTSPKGRTVYGL